MEIDYTEHPVSLTCCRNESNQNILSLYGGSKAKEGKLVARNCISGYSAPMAFTKALHRYAAYLVIKIKLMFAFDNGKSLRCFLELEIKSIEY